MVSEAVAVKYKTMVLGFCLILMASCAHSFILEPGDLLFQDLDCGPLCTGIDQVTRGYQGYHFSHVAMVVRVGKSHIWIVEANSPQVAEVTLSEFLSRSYDESGHPRVVVARLQHPYSLLIPEAIMLTPFFWGHPYNADFHPNTYAQYCSQLIFTLFKWANHGSAIFPQVPMTFKVNAQSAIHPAWISYFKRLHRAPPEGLPGISPAMLSMSEKIQVIGQYGMPHVSE